MFDWSLSEGHCYLKWTACFSEQSRVVRGGIISIKWGIICINIIINTIIIIIVMIVCIGEMLVMVGVALAVCSYLGQCRVGHAMWVTGRCNGGRGNTAVRSCQKENTDTRSTPHLHGGYASQRAAQQAGIGTIVRARKEGIWQVKWIGINCSDSVLTCCTYTSGIILGMGSANEVDVTLSWAHTENGPCTGQFSIYGWGNSQPMI